MTPLASLEEPQPTTRQESPEPQQARARLAQLELLLKHGRTMLQDLRTQVDVVKKERDDLRGECDALRDKLESAVEERDQSTGKCGELSLLMGDLRDERDRIADELRSTEFRRASLEEKLAVAAGDVEQLRADADRALTLAREIMDVYTPAFSSAASSSIDVE